MRLALEIILAIVSLALMVVVLMQPSKSNGLTLFTGVKDTHYTQNKGRTREAFLWKVTVVLSIIWAILCAAMAFI